MKTAHVFDLPLEDIISTLWALNGDDILNLFLLPLIKRSIWFFNS